MTVFGVYGVSHRYRNSLVLDNVSFELERGEILALLGPNGSGKSTLLKAAAGILPLSSDGSSGQVRHHGLDFLAMEPAVRARHVAYIPPDLHAEFPLSAFETVLLGRSCQGSELRLNGTLPAADARAVQEAMELCLCWKLRDQDLHTLSGGERQLVALARALAQRARILFLDEALSRMDLNHQAAIGKVLVDLAADGCSVVLVSHDVNLASEWARSALLLKNGKTLAFGPLKDVLNEANVRALYPSSDLIVAPSPCTGAPKVFFGRSP